MSLVGSCRLRIPAPMKPRTRLPHRSICRSLGIIALAAATAAALGCTRENGEASTVSISKIVVQEELQRLSGDNTTPGAWRDRAVVNIWASWCSPCLAELPELERLSNLYRSSGLSIVGLTPADDVFLSEELLLRLGISFANYAYTVGGLTERQLNVEAFPTTLLVDGAGNIIDRFSGQQDWSSDEMLARLSRKLK